MQDDPFKRLAQRADRKHQGGRGHGGLQQHKLIYLFRDKQVFSTEIYGDLISHVLFICTGFNYVLKRQHVRVGMVI